MKPYVLHPFKGLRGSIANANGEGATSCSNFVRNQIHGFLQQQVGYAKVFDVPASDALRKLGNIEVKDIFNFYVPDHGGRSITVCVGSYMKTAHGYYPPPPPITTDIPTTGIWVRPYWDGTVWVDAWFELTEFYVFQLSSWSGSTITIDNTAGDDLSFLNSDALAGFTIGFMGIAPSLLHYNLELVVSSQAVAPQLTILGDTADWGSHRTAGEFMYVYRNFFNKVLPATTSPQIHGLLNQAIVTTGNDVTDASPVVFFKTKTFSFPYTNVLDGLYAEPSMFDLSPVAWQIAERTRTIVPVGLPAGTYGMKSSLVMDDGSESALKDAIGQVASAYGYIAKTPMVGGNLAPGFSVMLGGFVYSLVMVADRINKIDLSTKIVADSGYVHDVTTYGPTRALFTDGTYLYLVCCLATISTIVRKIDPVTMLVVGSSGYFLASPIATGVVAGGVLFIGGDSNRILRLKLGDFTWDTAITLAVAPTAGQASADATFVYFPLSNHATGDAVAIKISDGSLAYITSTGFTGYGFSCFVVGSDLFIGSSDGKVWKVAVGYWTAGILWFTALANSIIYAMGLGANSEILVAAASSSYSDSKFYILEPAGVELFSYTETFPDLTVNIFVSGFQVYVGLIGAALDVFIGNANTTLVVSGYEDLTYKLYVSPGLIPRRAHYIRLYMEKDGEGYYAVRDIDLTSVVISASSYWDSETLHHYCREEIAATITAADWTAAEDSALVNLNRAIDDTGVVQYSHAIVAGRTTFAVGGRQAGTLYPNKVFTSIQHGSGVPQYDVFASGVNILDVEFSDGDQAIGLGNVGDRILVLKKRSLVLLSDDGRGGWDRTVVTKGVGCASAKSIVSWDNKVYWLDYSGFYSYDTSGLRFIGLPIRQEIKALSEAVKEGAEAVLDRDSKYYRCAVAGTQYCYDLQDDAAGQTEWMMESYVDQPTKFCEDTLDGGVVFLDSLTQKISKLGAPRHDGQDFTMDFVSTDIDPIDNVEYDYLLHLVWMNYESDAPIHVTIYLDDNLTPAQPDIVFPAGAMEGAIMTALGLRCKKFHVRLSCATTDDGQTVTIRKCGVVFNMIPTGGDVHIV